MKYLMFALCFLIPASLFAAPTCSKNGTRVIYTNGVTTSKFNAQRALEKIISLNLNSQIDQKLTKDQYKLAYNYEESISKDFLEAAVQRFPEGFIKSSGKTNAYAAYMGFIQNGFGGAIYDASLNAIVEAITDIQGEWLLNYKNSSQYLLTVNEIIVEYEKAIANGERIFAISHSQGGLFMNDVYSRLTYADKTKYFAGFQIATPANQNPIKYFGHATHDKDRLINSIRNFIGAFSANILAPFIVENSNSESVSDNFLEAFMNHGILTTYLHDSDIKPQVITKLVKTAQLLESNCARLGTYHPQDEGSAQIINHIEPGETISNLIDFDLMTFGMDSETKNNLRFRLLIEPSEDEELASGAEYIKASLTGETNLELWDGDGSFPSDSRLQFAIPLSPTNPKINVLLENKGSELTVPIYTTIIPEIKKQICYSARSGMPANSRLRVTFANIPEGILAPHATVIRDTVPAGTCKDFYLIYNTGYFFELLVYVTTPEATGYISNWDQEAFDTTGDGLKYDYKFYDSKPMNINSTLVFLGNDGTKNYYEINLVWQNVSPSTILVY